MSLALSKEAAASTDDRSQVPIHVPAQSGERTACPRLTTPKTDAHLQPGLNSSSHARICPVDECGHLLLRFQGVGRSPPNQRYHEQRQ